MARDAQAKTEMVYVRRGGYMFQEHEQAGAGGGVGSKQPPPIISAGFELMLPLACTMPFLCASAFEVRDIIGFFLNVERPI